MLALALAGVVMFADPVVRVQVRYPVYRTTITTTSGTSVAYTLPADAPPELRRAYKVLEVAERDVRITEALQVLRAEMVQNERRLEALRAARLGDYLTYRLPNPRARFDPALVAPPESSLKFGMSQVLTGDSRVERALAAIDRLADAQDQLHQTIVAIAYPDRPRPLPNVRPVPPVGGVVPPARVPNPLADAERAEKTAADAESVAEERERGTRQAEQAAEARYRDSLPSDRAATKAEWLKARDAWEQARKEWDTARVAWRAARDKLAAVRAATRPAADSAVRPAAVVGSGRSPNTVAPSR
ncbi:MAG: hypothetical protein J0I06_21525 [Planctomycetes bacterium]|nr:hypothetical protein [Planctomycetota bacterium]